MQTITKAVIPAAGLGTRMLPISHAVPKEMLPIVDLPAVAYLVEEAAKSGITDILIITNRDKDSIEDFFDYSPEYEAALSAKGKTEVLSSIRRYADLANVTFLRQKTTRGLGHAIGRARAFVGDEPFAVLYGDDIIFSRTPVVKQLIDAYEKYGRPVVGVKRVSPEWIQKYSSLKVTPIKGDPTAFFCDDMIEKPKPGEEFSDLSVLGRVLLTPDVFDILDRLAPGAGGEIQLTDAMAKIAREKGITALEFEGERFDLGSKVGFLKANVVAGVSHPETGEEFRAFLKRFVSEMEK